mmetsp:Transcript_69618/g.194595  ORF Transcript_69618/g.194595 Transcript_69618/m.194595 type:complete len:118 (-) Transcript_69618:95-448(-)
MGGGASKLDHGAPALTKLEVANIIALERLVRAAGAAGPEDDTTMSKLLVKLAGQAGAFAQKSFDNRIHAENGLLARFKDGTVHQLATFQQPGEPQRARAGRLPLSLLLPRDICPSPK